MTVWDKNVRRGIVASVGAWTFLAGAAIGRHALDTLAVATLIGAAVCVTVISGVAVLLHGHVYQLGYLAGRMDAADGDSSDGAADRDDHLVGDVIPLRTGTD